jgi:crotonobetainyl-CoA:carnitine CoA-transferase CaiB-like acyl-CoA transferase
MDEVDAAVTAWTSQLDKDEVFRLLQQADIPSWTHQKGRPGPPPCRGEHTAEILHDRLNLSDEQIQRLAADEVI